jgi:hypothetical protein
MAMDYLLSLQFRNSRLRGRITRLRNRAGASVQRKIDGIASEQLVTRIETEQSVQITYQSLKKQALVLIEGGAATQNDFEGML